MKYAKIEELIEVEISNPVDKVTRESGAKMTTAMIYKVFCESIFHRLETHSTLAILLTVSKALVRSIERGHFDALIGEHLARIFGYQRQHPHNF